MRQSQRSDDRPDAFGVDGKMRSQSEFLKLVLIQTSIRLLLWRWAKNSIICGSKRRDRPKSPKLITPTECRKTKNTDLEPHEEMAPKRMADLA